MKPKTATARKNSVITVGFLIAKRVNHIWEIITNGASFCYSEATDIAQIMLKRRAAGPAVARLCRYSQALPASGVLLLILPLLRLHLLRLHLLRLHLLRLHLRRPARARDLRLRLRPAECPHGDALGRSYRH